MSKKTVPTQNGKNGSIAAKPASSGDSTYSEPEFVLKHRVVGAAFLLFFGALFLPWVLGAPGEEQQVKQNAQVASANTKADSTSTSVTGRQTANSPSVTELAAAIAGEEVDAEERVYISKITPLDGASSSTRGKTVPVRSADADKPSVKPSVTKTPAKQSADSGKSTQVQNAAVTSANSASADPKLTINEADKASPPSTSLAAVTKNTSKTNTPPPIAIEVGWIVQVGVFTDERGAGKVVEDLRNKGFQPSTTVVDTNRGPASGTRIWLGPFTQRVDAAKAKAELTNKTGEAGFIRAYP